MSKLLRHRSPREYIAATEAYVRCDEARSGLVYSIASSLVRRGDPPAGVYLVSAHEGDAIVGIAAWVPPWNLVLDAWRHSALPALCADLMKLRPAGALAPVDVFAELERLWVPQTRAVVSQRAEQHLYVLNAVVAPREGDGEMRPARPGDAETLYLFAKGFQDDVSIRVRVSPVEFVDACLRRGGLYVWDVGGSAVSMAYANRGYPTSARIGYVYTPGPARGRGYASRLVAALSQALLDEGCSHITLFAETTNETSNRVYRAIGFHRLDTFVECVLDYE